MTDIVERLKTFDGSKYDPWATMEEAADTIESLRAENDKLREALKPFAAKAMAVEAQYENCLPADNLSAGIKYRALRAARAALISDKLETVNALHGETLEKLDD